MSALAVIRIVVPAGIVVVIRTGRRIPGIGVAALRPLPEWRGVLLCCHTGGCRLQLRRRQTDSGGDERGSDDRLHVEGCSPGSAFKETGCDAL